MNMKKLLSKNLVKQVAKNWKKQYFSKGKWFDPIMGSAEDIYKKLLRASSEKEVNEIVGNDSWTAYTCDECGEDFKVGVMFGKKTHICQKCITEAKSLK